MDMELSEAVEDDVFFADLSQRISLLITEDDDDDESPVKCPATVPVQAYSHASQPFFAPNPFFYEAAYGRETKGTGVFIPKSSMPKRKNRSGRSKNNDKKRAATTLPSNTTTTNINNNSSHISSACYYYSNSRS